MVMKRFFTYDMLYVKYPSRANINHWNYTNLTLENGQSVKLLTNYLNTSLNDFDVPSEGTLLNDATTATYQYNSPFHNHRYIKKVDLMDVPFRNQSMCAAFRYCQNLQSVTNMNSQVTNMAMTFYGCYNFNSPVAIPHGVTNMYEMLCECRYFNYPLVIPNTMVNMNGAFNCCNNFNQPIDITNCSYLNDITSLFLGCNSFNQPFNIPNHITSLHNLFRTSNFNQPINIP